MTTGTKEWAKRNCNLEQVGCEHDCRYCYAKAMAIRFGRATAESWKYPRIDGTNHVARHKDHGVTMFPTAHDCTSNNAVLCYKQIGAILASGDDVLFVSKASAFNLHIALAQFIGDCNFQSRIEVRVTIGSANDAVLKYWEPGAPCFEDRLAALKWAHDHGFPTSVSMEPMLDLLPYHVITAVAELVSRDRGIWLGTANDLVKRVAINCPGDTEARANAEQLKEAWNYEAVSNLYSQYKNEPLIHWKDSIRKVVGI